MPIDDELKAAIHDAVIKHMQPHGVETQLIALLNELSEQDVSADRKAHRVGMIQSEIDISRLPLSEQQ